MAPHLRRAASHESTWQSEVISASLAKSTSTFLHGQSGTRPGGGPRRTGRRLNATRAAGVPGVVHGLADGLPLAAGTLQAAPRRTRAARAGHQGSTSPGRDERRTPRWVFMVRLGVGVTSPMRQPCRIGPVGRRSRVEGDPGGADAVATPRRRRPPHPPPNYRNDATPADGVGHRAARSTAGPMASAAGGPRSASLGPMAP